jgi:hypothetical protein
MLFIITISNTIIIHFLSRVVFKNVSISIWTQSFIHSIGIYNEIFFRSCLTFCCYYAYIH